MNLNQIFAFSYHLYKIIFQGYSDKLIGISVDITNKCNLHCKHCYWWRQRLSKELSEAEWINLIKKIKKKNPFILQAYWLGGEPLLRASLLEKLFKFFKFNSVITNGVILLPRWKNVSFSVSVDGIEEDYEKIRGKGIYQKVKNNILKNKDLNLHLTCTLNKINFKNIDKFIKEWIDVGIKGVNFTIYTEGKTGDNKLRLSLKERNAVLNKIIALKDKYGSFIYGTKNQYNYMKTVNCMEATSWCRRYYHHMGLCLNSNGGIKAPCIFADDVNCNYCGCSLPYALWGAKKRDFKTIVSLIKH